MALERHLNITALPIMVKMHFAEHTLLGLICQFFLASIQKIYAVKNRSPISRKRQRSLCSEVFFSEIAAGEVCSVLGNIEVQQFFAKQISLQSVTEAMTWLRDLSELVKSIQPTDPEDYFLKFSQEIHDVLQSAESIFAKSYRLRQTLLNWITLQDSSLMIGELSRNDEDAPASSCHTPIEEVEGTREVFLRLSVRFTMLPYLLKWVNPIHKLSLKNVAANQIPQLLELIDQQPFLTELAFSYSHMTPLDMVGIIEYLQGHETLTSLSFLNNTGEEPSSEESQHFFEEAGSRIAAILANDSRLTRLKFDYPLSYLSEDMEQAWLEALQHNASLVELGQADDTSIPEVLSLLRRNELNIWQRNSTLYMWLQPATEAWTFSQAPEFTRSSPKRTFSRSPEPASSSQELTFLQSPEPASSSQEIEIPIFRSKRARR
jgi:hypothetical protein